MNSSRPVFSICIPAYNRAQYLPALLDSVLTQKFADFNVLICEDHSPERGEIARIVQDYAVRYPGKLIYHENERNLGYDANIRNLVEMATGQFCFFMGNDDILCAGALEHVADIVSRYENVGLVVKSYAFFNGDPGNVNQEIRYFTEERLVPAGRQAIALCFRRSGVISGYTIHRDSALAAATSKFDGTLYYQMHLTGSVLCDRCAVFTPRVLVLCRDGEPPDFGNSSKEAETYVPGHYTEAARLRMVGGALSIAEDLKATRGVDVVDAIKRDFANYFYVYIRDQLDLPPGRFLRLYWQFARMGLYRYPLFTANCLVAYLLGARKFDLMTRQVRIFLGRTPHLGIGR